MPKARKSRGAAAAKRRTLLASPDDADSNNVGPDVSDTEEGGGKGLSASRGKRAAGGRGAAAKATETASRKKQKGSGYGNSGDSGGNVGGSAGCARGTGAGRTRKLSKSCENENDDEANSEELDQQAEENEMQNFESPSKSNDGQQSPTAISSSAAAGTTTTARGKDATMQEGSADQDKRSSEKDKTEDEPSLQPLPAEKAGRGRRGASAGLRPSAKLTKQAKQVPAPGMAKRGSGRAARGRAPVNYAFDEDDGGNDEEEAEEDGSDDEQSEEEFEDDDTIKGKPKGKGKRGRGRGRTTKRSKKASSETKEASENSLVKQFGFQPVSGEGRIAQVDWTPKVVANGKGKKKKKEKEQEPQTIRGRKRSKPNEPPQNERSTRRSTRGGTAASSRGRVSYAEPGSPSDEDGDGDDDSNRDEMDVDGEDGDASREDSDVEEEGEEDESKSETSEDEDEFKPGDKKRRNPSRTGKLSAKAKEKEASSAGRRGGGGRRSGGEKPDSMKKDDVGNKSTQRRKSSRESRPVIKPNVGQRRSAREKAAVNYGVDTVNSSDDLDLMDEDDEEKEEDSEAIAVSSGEEESESVKEAAQSASKSSGAKRSISGSSSSKSSSAAAEAADKPAPPAKPPKQRAAKRRRMEEEAAAAAAGEGGDDSDVGTESKRQGGAGGGTRSSSSSSSSSSQSTAKKKKSGRQGVTRRDRRGDDSGDGSTSDVGEGEEEEREDYVDDSDNGGDVDEEDEDGWSGDEEDGDDDDQPPLRIQKILARKSLKPWEWKELCKDMNTDQVTAGSVWHQEELMRASENGEAPQEKFLIKWNGMSYLHVSWEHQSDLVELVGGQVKIQIRKFKERESGYELELERGDGEYFDPSLVILERVLDVDEVEDEETRLLIKWLGTGYADCTYEAVSDLDSAGLTQEYLPAVESYHRRENVSALKRLVKRQKSDKRKEEDRKKDKMPDLEKKPPVFKNGGSLRDYQRTGVSWMLYNWIQSRGSILADEMGLGKTLQTVSFLTILQKEYHMGGPFLIIAPLSTVMHWQREFQNWSDMNTIIYHGSQEDREILDAYEMEFASERERKEKDKIRLANGRRPWKCTVVVTTPELCVKKDVSLLLGRKIHWDVLVVDEAHRLKSDRSKLNVALKERFSFDATLLLTGTPLQNNTEELWTLLNLVDAPKFRSKEGFVNEYGDLQRAEDVNKLQERIKPYLLRRMKEDVEKAVPPKEETIIEVELTEIQKQYYRAIYEQNTSFLLQGKRAQDGPSLMNLAMELRKCCNHPYLITGVEDAVRMQMGGGGDKDHLVKYSGKLVLLDKLLPRLKEQGHRVLLFSQFKIMLNVLEDYLIASGISYGRIDGSIQGRLRQKAIDSFQAPNSEMFVMLLSTRAGGVGITLTAADTCIIYDSDWNPQNDVQAQARCHRIGQTKSVKVYRLLVAKTYEMHMFKTASKKLGLDQAVLAGSRPTGSGSGDRTAPTKAEVEKLLKHGAYDVFKDGKEGDAAKKFCEDSIDAILSRAKVINHAIDGVAEGKPTNSFSKASFVATDADEKVDVNDPEFWTKCVGLTVPDVQEEKLGRRAARGGKKEYKAVSDSDADVDDFNENSEFEEEDSGSEISVPVIEKKRLWSNSEIAEVAKSMLCFGYGRWQAIRVDASVTERSIEEVADVGRAIMAVMLQTEAMSMAQATIQREYDIQKLNDAIHARQDEAARQVNLEEQRSLKKAEPPRSLSQLLQPPPVATPTPPPPPPPSATTNPSPSAAVTGTAAPAPPANTTIKSVDSAAGTAGADPTPSSPPTRAGTTQPAAGGANAATTATATATVARSPNVAPGTAKIEVAPSSSSDTAAAAAAPAIPQPAKATADSTPSSSPSSLSGPAAKAAVLASVPAAGTTAAGVTSSGIHVAATLGTPSVLNVGASTGIVLSGPSATASVPSVDASAGASTAAPSVDVGGGGAVVVAAGTGGSSSAVAPRLVVSNPLTAVVGGGGAGSCASAGVVSQTPSTTPASSGLPPRPPPPPVSEKKRAEAFQQALNLLLKKHPSSAMAMQDMKRVVVAARAAKEMKTDPQGMALKIESGAIGGAAQRARIAQIAAGVKKLMVTASVPRPSAVNVDGGGAVDPETLETTGFVGKGKGKAKKEEASYSSIVAAIRAAHDASPAGGDDAAPSTAVASLSTPTTTAAAAAASSVAAATASSSSAAAAGNTTAGDQSTTAFSTVREQVSITTTAKSAPTPPSSTPTLSSTEPSAVSSSPKETENAGDGTVAAAVADQSDSNAASSSAITSLAPGAAATGATAAGATGTAALGNSSPAPVPHRATVRHKDGVVQPVEKTAQVKEKKAATEAVVEEEIAVTSTAVVVPALASPAVTMLTVTAPTTTASTVTALVEATSAAAAPVVTAPTAVVPAVATGGREGREIIKKNEAAAEEDDPKTILLELWKPRNVQKGSKFQEGLLRISHKLGLLDEIHDLANMLHSPNPPFGRLHCDVQGWGAVHDKWLAERGYEKGWFTPMQKKRTLTILADPHNTWPGLITKPEDTTMMARRLRSLVGKFRDERRQAVKEAKLKDMKEKEQRITAEIKEIKRRQQEELKRQQEETSARSKREKAEREAEEKAKRMAMVKREVAKRIAINQERLRMVQDTARAMEVAAAANSASRGGGGIGGGSSGSGSSSGSSIGTSPAMRLPTIPASLSSAAAGTTSAAAGGGVAGGGSMAANNNLFSAGVSSAGGGGAAGILRTKMVSVLPPGLDESSPRVRKIYDKFGRWKSLYRISADPVAPSAEIVNGVGRSGGGSGGITASSSPHCSAGQQGRSGGMVVSPQSSPAARANGGPGAITNPITIGMPSTPFVGAAAGVGRSSSGSPPAHAHSSIPVGAGARRAINGGGGGSGSGSGGWDTNAMKAMMRDDTSMAASRSEDGINLKNAMFNMGVPVSMLENDTASAAVTAAAGSKQSPLRRALDLSWAKLVAASKQRSVELGIDTGDGGLSADGARSIGVHLLSKAAYFAKDNFGLKLPQSAEPPPNSFYATMSEREKDALVQMLKAAAKATQLRASLLNYTELQQVQAFAARLARAKELQGQTMPPWWKVDVHDAHLLVVSCVYGGSNDRGVQKALLETTARTLQLHGSSPGEENSTSSPLGAPGGSAGTSSSTTATGTVATAAVAAEDASLTTPLANMNPPLLPGLAKARIQNLHNAAFAKAKRIVPSSLFRSRIVSSPSSQQTSNGNSSAGAGAGNGSTAHNVFTTDATATVVEGVPGDSSDSSRVTQPAAPTEVEREVRAKLARAAAVMLKANIPGPDSKNHQQRLAAVAMGVPLSPAPAPTSADQKGAKGSKKRSAEVAPAVPVAATVAGSEVEVLDLSHLPDSPRLSGALESAPAKKLKVSPSVVGSSSSTGADALGSSTASADGADKQVDIFDSPMPDAAPTRVATTTTTTTKASAGNSQSKLTPKKPKKMAGTLESFWSSP